MSDKNTFRKMVLEMAQNIKDKTDTKTEAGSSLYLLFGAELSRQSISVRFGNQLETLLNDFSTICGFPKHQLANQLVDGHQIDSLRIFGEFLEYDEQKTNAGLDSEKLPATVNKIIAIKEKLENLQSLPVRACILHSTVWEKSDAPTFNTYYVRYERGGVHVKTMKEFFQQLNVSITKEEFYNIFREAGDILK